jgi:hypothetical protein
MSRVITFSDMLYTEPVSESMTVLPSPASLKRKIIVKAKKQPPAEKDSDSESEAEEEAGKVAAVLKANIREVPYMIILAFDFLSCFVYPCYCIEIVAADFFWGASLVPSGITSRKTNLLCFLFTIMDQSFASI